MGNRELRQREKDERMKQDIMNRLHKQIIARVRMTSIACCCLVLHDKFGFGKQRLEKFMGEVTDTFDSIYHEYITFEDIKRTVYDELGIDIDKAEEYILKKYNKTSADTSGGGGSGDSVRRN